MPALFFPNLDALRLVLTSGIVPPRVTQAPAWTGYDPQGRLWLEPAELPPREVLAALTRLGVQALGDGGLLNEPIGCWAELLPLRPAPPAPPTGGVLFELPDARLAHFVAGIRRLNRSPIGVRLLDGDGANRAWVIATTPPMTVLLACDDPDSAVEAFTEQAPGIWVRHGWEHPLPESLLRPPGRIALLRPPRSVSWQPEAVPVAGFPDYGLPTRPTRVCAPGVLPPVSVRLRLGRSTDTASPELWVFDGTEANTFWDYCRTADERVLRQFEAATVTRNGAVRLVVRQRPGKAGSGAHAPLPGPAYRPDPRLAGLFVPTGWDLRPVVRARELANLLHLRPHRVTWVEAAADGGVIPHALPAGAFAPVLELLEYAVPARVHLAPEGGRAETFPLGRFTLAPVREEPAGGPAETTDQEQPGDPRADRAGERPGWFKRSLERLATHFRLFAQSEPTLTGKPGPAPEPARRRKPPAARRSERVERKLASADALVHGHDRAARRHELEARLIAEFARLGTEERAARWAELAAVYGATGNAPDAAVCWINALWESPDAPESWLEQWLLAECRAARQPDPNDSLDRWLGEPGRFGAGRVVAAYTAWAIRRDPHPPELSGALPRVLALLDQHFDDLPVRAAWLARLAITRLCDGDALGLARWRDRLLSRLRDKGPGLDLDEPSFLRFHGTASPDRFQNAREWLARAHDPIRDWLNRLGSSGPLQFAGIDPEVECTAAYARMMLAWGLGCLGERTRSRDWAARSRKTLTRSSGSATDPALHAFLADLFLARIRDAQDGRPARAGLPPELQARYDQLPDAKLVRYAVDKFRRFARILEPTDRVREYAGKEFKEFWGNDRLGERLHVLAGRTEPAYLSDEARTLLEACAADPGSGIVPRVVFTLLEVAPHLQPPLLTPLLALAVPALDWLETWLQAGRWDEAERAARLPVFQARLIENAFTAAVGANPITAVRPLVEHLLRRSPADATLRVALTHAAGPLFRSFRKLGYRTEAEALLRVLDPEPAGWPADAPYPPSRLGLAIGWFAVGDEDAGGRILNEARDRLYLGGRGDDRDRTQLAIAYAAALGFAPPGIAPGRLWEIFQRLDRLAVTGSTNRYFTLKPLELIDTVVRSVVTEDFALGPAVRGWLDDDEFLIRRRIHRDMAAVLKDDGIG